MQSARAQPSGLGGYGACLLAALLWLNLLPQHAQAISATNITTTQATKTTPSLSQICGRTNFQGKIFGGQMAKPGRWPWQASLRLHGSHICGAVLIDKNWVAGAAHCFQRSRKPSDYRVLLGYHQLGSPTEYSRQMTVSRLILHENFNKVHNQGNDIVLIQLHKPVTYSSHILPACVPENTTKVPLDRSCWISGWGMLREDEFLAAPFPLQDGEVFLMDDKQCEAFFQTPEVNTFQYKVIKEDMICAGDAVNGKYICRGDSGGPLVCLLDGSWYVIGLASWAAACLESVSSPNIFTKVSHFSDWIKKKKQETPDADPFSAPPEEKAPTLIGWRSFGTGTTIKPRICVTALSSQILLLQSFWFRFP